MFVQIARGRHKKKKQSSNEDCEDDDNGSIKSGDGKEEEGENFSEVKLDENDEPEDESRPEKEVTIVGTSKQTKDSTFLDKISEKAAKLKKGSLGKLFGEKENDVKIYTIDQEMKRSHPSSHAGLTHKTDFPKFLNTEFAEPKTHHKFHSSELTQKLEKSRNPMTFAGEAMKTLGTQASPFPRYRLFFLPCSNWNDPDDKLQSAMRVLLSQISLASFLFVWVIFGALLFFLTEGSTEYELRDVFLSEEINVQYSLATDFRVMASNSTEWKPTMEKYLLRHKTAIIDFLNKGYSEDGEIWTYSGSFLVCVSIINIFGYGFPIPRTVGGNVGLFIFTIVGLPMNWILLRSAGLSIAARIQISAKDVELHLHTLRKRIQNVRKYGDSKPRSETDWPRGLWEGEFRPPWWLPCMMPVVLFIWYTLGCLLLGLARLGSDATASAVLFFPRELALNFSKLAPFTRLSFAVYLEMSSLLASLAVALIDVPSPTSFLDPFIKHSIVTNSMP